MNTSDTLELTAEQTAFLTARFACQTPHKQAWRPFCGTGLQCSGCSGSCGTSDVPFPIRIADEQLALI